jgi:DNA topoisomerase III
VTVLVLAEKPSVARDIASVLGARTRGEGHFHGSGWVVTWAIGHLVALAEPHEMDAAWKRWRLSDLPLLPESWPLVVTKQTRAQFEVVRRFLRSEEVRGVVCATDAGREGELIFRYIYEAARAKKPVRRLWISSLTPDAIADGFRSLKDGKSFDRLGDAARARSRADWLVGMNLSRLYSVLHDDNLSVGRVQTPTLAMIVARELEIRAFVPEDYLEVVATFDPAKAAHASLEAPNDPPVDVASKERAYQGTYVRPGVREPDTKRLPPDGKEASAIIDRAKRGTARIESVDRQSRRLPPPLLYDLTELQRHANRLYGFTAQRTLQLTQNLYEQRKLLSYPRTDSRHISRTVESTLPAVVDAIAGAYRPLLAEGTGARPLGPRFVDDARVSDHHAIIPTATRPPDDLAPDERRIYDLVCRRLLSAWHGDHVFAVTTVITNITWNDTCDRYTSMGSSVEIEGWKVLDVTPGGGATRKGGAVTAKGARVTAEPMLPGGLERGMPCRVLDARSIAKKTRPAPRFTDGTLLTAMESAGRTLAEDTSSGDRGLTLKEVSQAMRECGLGTPATRAAILETLLRREYVEREGKTLSATDKGIALIGVVHAQVKSPAMTGEWEAKLARIERGEGELDTFMREIEGYVRDVVGNAAAPPPRGPPPGERSPPHGPSPGERSPPRGPSPGEPSRGAGGGAERGTGRAEREGPLAPPRPVRSGNVGALLGTAFGFSSFRPYQEDVCLAAASGKDVLLVMPTGAGKSLCYQLPGLARGGTTLVVSPLIALMEDQVAQLVRRGLLAERIHSGRTRLESRAVCRAYLDGALDFLFIAPERLRVPGFPEMLAKRKPTLVAIDEAHCISQWGHDFRPDYRMLGERLPLLRPAPVIALTATATPTVQDDIATELRLASPIRFIHGFRRTNIGVEIIERNPSDRGDVVRRLLEDPTRRPAIVYAPTRAESEALARTLQRRLQAAAYHAGLSAGVRDEVQSAFLDGKLDVIIATTAFGMGIDKADVRTVIHTALPASVEGYYQEIGRAGRDGGPSRAVLLQSFVDTKTHDFFLERDYPDPDVLAKIHKAIPAKGTTTAALAKRAKVPKAAFEKALEKLGIHGGAVVDPAPDGAVRQGTAEWRTAYDRQRAHKREQIEKMRRFAETAACRMLQLVAHFGDQHDEGTPCGLCDVCAPGSCVAQAFRAPSTEEESAAARILEALRTTDGRTVGQLHRDLFGDKGLDRRGLDHVLGALARASLVKIVGDEFVKDGETIAFQRVWLAPSGRSAGATGTMRAMRIVETPPPSKKTAKKATGKRRPKRGKRKFFARRART